MEQRTLFTPPAPTGNLSDRQAYVYNVLQNVLQMYAREGSGLSSDEVGALLHERAGKHDQETRCSWCQMDGEGLMKGLRKKGLAKKRRAVGWVALHVPVGASESAQGDAIPF